MSKFQIEKNLLFGVLALHLDFATRGQFLDAAKTWINDKSKSLEGIFLEKGILGQEDCVLVSALVEKHFQRHGNSAEKSLAAISTFKDVCESIHDLGDQDLDLTLDFASASNDKSGSPELANKSPGDSSFSSRSRFDIVRFHAQGGLGMVSLAHDNELDREVALKEIQQEYADNLENRERFLLEAKVTGALEHPGIVPVYSLGRHSDGRPYYAMRFIRGESFKEEIDRFHKKDWSKGSASERVLEFRRLLQSIIDVCHAMHYSHSRGVLHRDIKPSNIMLGDYGETLVVDWGLAKSLDKDDRPTNLGEQTIQAFSGSGTTPTVLGKTIGTPQFMSPEQAAGKHDILDATSDVYSLGATLYSLLTGNPPVEGESLDEIMEKVKTGEIARPRLVFPSISPALEAICLKAMALGSKDRYQSSRGMARELEQWLADEPVGAYPEPIFQKIVRWIRRNKSWAIAAVATLFIVASVSMAAAVLVNKARIQEQIAKQEATKQKQEALRRYQQARSAVDTWLTGTSEALQYYPGVQQVRLHLLERAAKDYEVFSEQPSDSPEVELERGRSYLRLGDVRSLLKDQEKAKAAYRKANDVFEKLAQDNQDLLEPWLEAATSRIRLAGVMSKQGQRNEADKIYREAISSLENGPQDFKEAPETRLLFASLLVNRSVLLAERGSTQEAKITLQHAISEYANLTESGEARDEWFLDYAKAQDVLGRLLIDEGLDGEALVELQSGINKLTELVKKDSSNLNYLDSLSTLYFTQATALRKLGRTKEYLLSLQLAAENYDLLNQALPDAPFYLESLALTQTNLGRLYREIGQTQEAQDVLEPAMEVFTELSQRYPLHPNYREELAVTFDLWGQILMDLDQNENAKPLLEQASALLQDLSVAFPEVPVYQQRWAIAQSHYAQSQNKLGEKQASVESTQQAIKTLLRLTQLAPESPSYKDSLAFIYKNQGDLYFDSGDTEKAEESYQNATLLWRENIAISQSPEYQYHLSRFLVNCPLEHLRNPAEALTMVEKTLQAAPENASYHMALGMALYRTQEYNRSVQSLERSLTLRPYGEGRVYFFLALALKKQGSSKKAEAYFQRGLTWTQKNSPDRSEITRIQREAEAMLALPANK